MSRALTILALCTAFTAAGCGVEPDATQTEDALKKKKCWSNSDCGSLEFCNTEAAASCSSRGVCSPRGINLLCSNLYVPVCGCDGNTYPNGCQAHKAGASVAHNGACEVACNSNADCPSLEYCSTPIGQCGATGACKPRGINLFCSQIYQPVCGCDGNTYGNTCLAQKAGAAIDHTGACACDFQGTNVDGDTLAEQAWMDQSQTYFYTFTGNGTLVNNSGTFVVDIAPPCTRGTPFACKIAIRREAGTFTTSGTQVTLNYDNGNTATFTAETDCHNTWELIGHDFNQAMTLTVSTIFPTP